MKNTTVKIDGVQDLGMINAVSVFGGGLFTTFFYSLFAFLGIESALMSNKMAKVINKVTAELEREAQNLGADGIMDIKYQMTYLCVMAYGTAYKEI